MANNNALPSNRAPQFLRDMFHESQCYECDPWFECLDGEFGENHLYAGANLTRWQRMSARERGLWLTGKLWNDVGIMPSTLCMLLDMQPGSTYARGVRKLREDSWRDLLPENSRAA
jgi:hypothetical protein